MLLLIPPATMTLGKNDCIIFGIEGVKCQLGICIKRCLECPGLSGIDVCCTDYLYVNAIGLEALSASETWKML
jgi:hypothetical protein